MDIEFVVDVFEKHRNQELAKPMEQYMKNHFPYLGIKSPERRALTKEVFQKLNVAKEPFDEMFVLDLWKLPEREYQYIALDYLVKKDKQLTKEQLVLLERLILTKSWWDTVDVLAPKPVGSIALREKSVIQDFIGGWAHHENMWLRRAAILFQLKYKSATDEALLYRFILINATSKEFFIQKAIGWALREYSKTNRESVKQFILENPLMPLSMREGSKYLT
ncbi:DNA alkylation repair protein [Bacillus sp. T3]|uniref:DNA alkylation repair protein n=1 Tax=Bacillus sp. T3 TaxID=467262 RepID=UPI002981E4F9|nr:DNA alkylation repair protein [Bacillus sp. T3]